MRHFKCVIFEMHEDNFVCGMYPCRTNLHTLDPVWVRLLQALLPVFLDALHKTVPPAYNRLVVLSTDAEALSSCRRIHTYCLPWFDCRSVSHADIATPIHAALGAHIALLSPSSRQEWLSIPAGDSSHTFLTCETPTFTVSYILQAG